MPRTNKILIRSGTAAPSASDFATNEPAWDRTAKKLYIKAGDGTMVEIGASGGGGTVYVAEYATTANFPTTGQSTARIYVATDTGRIYRWTGTEYQELGAVSAYDSRWDLFLPPAPTNVTGTVASGQSVVSWTAPTVISATPITDYIVQYATSPYTSWTTFSDGTSTSTSATVTGLTNGTAYQFRVAAVNAIGTGSYSSASASVTPVAGDPDFSSVVLLLHGDGSGTSFTDSSSYARTLTANGSITQSTAQSKFGGKSISFPSSGSYLSMASATALNFGTGDFVIEGWLYLTSSTAYQFILGNDVDPGGYMMCAVNIDGNSGQIGLGRSGIAWPVVFSPHGISANTWTHFAISRSGSTNRCYINGSKIGSDVTDSTSWSFSNPRVGQHLGVYTLGGYLDDLRLTKGTSRSYTGSTITVPTAAYPDS